MLSLTQRATLKTHILATGDLFDLFTNGDLTGLAALLNTLASPAYFVWRTAVSRAEIYNLTSPDATAWDWTIYKGQGVAEQNAWVQMFMGDTADFGKANLRAGIGKIFGAANANTTHCLAMGRRASTRLEKLFAVATVSGVGQRGSAANPDTLSNVDGELSYTELVNL